MGVIQPDEDPETGDPYEHPFFSGLTDREKKFVLEYPKDFDQKRAALAAGYKHPNSKLLKKHKIVRALQHFIRPIVKAARLSIETAIAYARDVINADPADLFDENGEPIRDVRKVPFRTRRVIESYSYRETYYKNGKVRTSTQKVRFVKKAPALELLRKYFSEITPVKAGREPVAEFNCFSILDTACAFNPGTPQHHECSRNGCRMWIAYFRLMSEGF